MITIRLPVSKPCPYVPEQDDGELAVTWPGDAPELHQFAAQLARLTAEPITHEAFTRAVLALPGCAGALVVSWWRTGPFDIECREGNEGLTDGPGHLCARCGRALKPCDWCGESRALAADSETWPVTTRPGWDGYYHEPCRDREQLILSRGHP